MEPLMMSVVGGVISSIPVFIYNYIKTKKRENVEDESDSQIYLENTRISMISFMNQLRSTVMIWELHRGQKIMLGWELDDQSKKMVDIHGACDIMFEKLERVSNLISICNKNPHHKITYYFKLCMNDLIYVFSNCIKGFNSMRYFDSNLRKMTDTEKAIVFDDHGIKHNYKKSWAHFKETTTTPEGLEMVTDFKDDLKYIMIQNPDTGDTFKLTEGRMERATKEEAESMKRSIEEHKKKNKEIQN